MTVISDFMVVQDGTYSKVSGITDCTTFITTIQILFTVVTVCQDMSGLSKLVIWCEEASSLIWGIETGRLWNHDASFLVSPTWSKEIRGEKARDERKDSFISRVACTNSEEDAWSWSSIQGFDGRQTIDRTCRIFQVEEYEKWASGDMEGGYISGMISMCVQWISIDFHRFP